MEGQGYTAAPPRMQGENLSDIMHTHPEAIRLVDDPLAAMRELDLVSGLPGR